MNAGDTSPRRACMMFGGRLAEMWCRDACVPISMPMESTRQRGGVAGVTSMIRVAPGRRCRWRPVASRARPAANTRLGSLLSSDIARGRSCEPRAHQHARRYMD